MTLFNANEDLSNFFSDSSKSSGPFSAPMIPPLYFSFFCFFIVLLKPCSFSQGMSIGYKYILVILAKFLEYSNKSFQSMFIAWICRLQISFLSCKSYIHQSLSVVFKYLFSFLIICNLPHELPVLSLTVITG